MIDPLTATAAALAGIAGSGVAWRLHRRVRHVESQADALRAALRAERHAANRDPLTGLANRRSFFQAGGAMLADPARRPLIAAVLDVDDFKLVNDQLGHAAGDEVLTTVARRLAAFAGTDLVARLGGDEFAGLLSRPATDLPQAAAALTESLAAPMRVAGHPLRVTVSVGLAAVPSASAARLSDVLRQADAAMYQAKASRTPAGARPATAAAEPASPEPDWSTTMPVPTIDPHRRDPAAVAPADSYRQADPVWVYRADSWRAGVVEAASPQAVTVTYRPPNTRGTGVDTLTAAYLLPREDTDPLLDQQ